MAEIDRYIDVLSSANISRTIESYRAKIELTVTTRKKESCLDESLALRDRIIAALKDAGIDANDIEEGGGRLMQSSWSSSKTVVHDLHVANADMAILIQAMANVERIFAAINQSWFSSIKKDFSFSVPTPEFTDDANAAEAALKKAVENAKAKATILAQQAGLTLGDVISITEVSSNRKNLNPNQTGEMVDSMIDDSDLSFDEELPVNYLPAAARQGIARSFFRMRFGVTIAVK